MKLRPATVYLIGLVVGSILVAIVQTLSHWRGVELVSPFVSAWPILFLILLVLWIVEDSRAYPDINKPFEFDFLVFIWAIPYLPYYLWHTRRLKGLLFLAGFVALYFLGYFAQLAVDVVR